MCSIKLESEIKINYLFCFFDRIQSIKTLRHGFVWVCPKIWCVQKNTVYHYIVNFPINIQYMSSYPNMPICDNTNCDNVIYIKPMTSTNRNITRNGHEPSDVGGKNGTRFSTYSINPPVPDKLMTKPKWKVYSTPLQSSTNRPLLYMIVRYVKLPEGISAVFMVQSPLIIQIGNHSQIPRGKNRYFAASSADNSSSSLSLRFLGIVMSFPETQTGSVEIGQ